MSAMPYRILIADDEPSILNAYSSVLRANGQLKQADAGLDDLAVCGLAADPERSRWPRWPRSRRMLKC